MSDENDTAAQIASLQEDNEALKAMIQRSASTSAATAFRDASASEKLAIQFERVVEELKHERDLRSRVQSLASETKDQLEVALLRKEAEVKRLSDALKASRFECEEMKRKAVETDSQSDQLRKENAAMKEALKRLKLNQDGTPYAGTSAAASPPPDYKSGKPFSAVLRSVSPAAGRRTNIGSPLPASVTPRTTKQQPSDPNAVPRRGTYSAANPLRTASKSPAPVRPRPASTLPDLKSGARVLWNGLPGVVRFIGTVHCLGAGTWVGVEVESGKGEHNGALGGVRYFVSEKRSGVFCKVSELSAPRAAPSQKTKSEQQPEQGDTRQ